MKSVIAIIPARGGSKSIPNKNIKDLGGKPLIAWTIESAKESGLFSRVIVSTDSAEIAEIAKKYGADVPFIRPAELAQDTTPTLPVLHHAISWLKENENHFADIVVLLEPTFPFRKKEHIKGVVDLLLETDADSVVTVREVPGHHNPHWQFVLDEKGRLNIFTGGPLSKIITRRQALPKTYTRNGAVYAFKTSLLFSNEQSIYGADCRAFVMDQNHGVDLDTQEDWYKAEKIIKS